MCMAGHGPLTTNAERFSRPPGSELRSSVIPCTTDIAAVDGGCPPVEESCAAGTR